MRAAPSSAIYPSAASTVVQSRPAGRVGVFFILISTLSYVYISPATLQLLGWSYSGGGSEIEKLHPGTYLLFFALIVMRFSNAGFFQSVIAKFRNDIGLASLAITSCAAAFYAVLVKEASIAPFIDTFATTVVIFAVFATFEERPLAIFRRAVDIFMIVNIAIIALEYALHRPLVPHYVYELNGPGLTSEFADELFDRPAAFFGHPLAASGFLSLYALANVIVQMRSPSGKLWRILIASFALLAALLTGGRSPLFAALVGVGLIVFSFTVKALVGGVLRRSEARTALLLFAIFVVAVPVALQLGAFDLLFDRLANDKGSALARTYAFDILANMSAQNLWLGIPSSAAVAQQQEYGLIAIEISWVNFIVSCGIVFTVPLFISYLLFLLNSLRRFCVFAFAPALFFLIVHASSNGIWSKSTSFAAEIAIVLSYTRKDVLEQSYASIRRSRELPSKLTTKEAG